MRNGPEQQRAPYPPSGYSLDQDPDALTLRGPDGSMVAVFGERADPREIEWAAWEDFGGRR